MKAKNSFRASRGRIGDTHLYSRCLGQRGIGNEPPFQNPESTTSLSDKDAMYLIESVVRGHHIC